MTRILVFTTALVTATLFPLITAQQIGTKNPEVHPRLTTYKCSTSGGCIAQNRTSIALEWTFHSIHDADDNSCFSGTLNSTLCPNSAECGQNCFIEGADYASEGIRTDGGSALTLNQYRRNTTTNKTTSVSPRVYLFDESTGNYSSLQLLNQELAFDVNVSTLICGMNGALYLSEMDASGGRSADNPAAAAYGSGYCDAQCPVQAWINGSVNTNSAGACCNEMDIWEANANSTAFTPHPCSEPHVYACSGSQCGSSGVCDKSGCGYNAYALGNHSYYGAGLVVDTSRPFTVVTQFVTDDNTTTGTLSEVRRLYVQNGVVIQNAVNSATGSNAITDSYCASADSFGQSLGGLKQMGEALGRGMVLVFSIWNDASQYMNWLDSGNAGPCGSTAGNPTTIEAQEPGTSVTFSNIKWGDIGSTYTS